jgi:DNA polymerase III alpha subunit
VGLTQLDQNGVAAVGLPKLDLLSNRALSTLAEAQEAVRVLSPPEAVSPSPAGPETEDGDPATLALLARGDTLGVSHLETPGMRLLLRRLRRRSLAELAQALALARPAAAPGRETLLARRSGAEVPNYPHPALAEVMGESQGLLLYDDDLLATVEILTGLPPSEADALRRRLVDPRG